MSEKLFVAGLLVGAISLVVLSSVCTALEYMEFEYWVPTSVAIFVSASLAAIAGYLCGTSIDE